MNNLFTRYTQHFRENLRLALPIMGAQLGQVTVNLADNLMVGRLGAAPLAAVSLANAILAVLMVLGFGLSFALQPLISEAHASGRQRRISQYFKHSMIVNIVFGILSLVAIYMMVPLIDMMGQDPAVVVHARPYLVISAWTMIPLMIFQALRSYAEGMSETLPVMIAIIIGNVINIGLNYVFIFGKIGFKPMGVAGAAYGTLITRIMMIGILMLIFYYWKDLFRYLRAANFRHYQRAFFKRILELGVPSSLQGFFEICAFAGAALMMGYISKDAQAAHQIAINLASITFMICIGFSVAVTIRIGNQMGYQDYEKLREIGWAIFIQVMLFMGLAAIGFVLFNDFLPTLYIDNDIVVNIAATLLIFAAAFQIPDGLQVALLGALRGLQDVKIPTLFTFIAYWLVGIPVGYYLAITLEWGPEGVWAGLIIGLFVSALLLLLRFNYLSGKLIEKHGKFLVDS